MKTEIKYINILFGMLLLILAILQVIILNTNSTGGEKWLIVNKNINIIEDENNLLSQQIASSSAISTIEIKAKELGLVSKQNLVSLTKAPPLAFFPKISL